MSCAEDLPNVGDLPRLGSFAVFAEDVRAAQSAHKSSSAALAAKHTQTPATLQKSEAVEAKLRASYVLLALRVMLAHYASMQAAERPQVYVRALRCSAERVEAVYPADRRFFATAQTTAAALKHRLFAGKKNAAQRLEFEELSKALAKTLGERGLLGAEVARPASPHLAEEPLTELLAHSDFRNVRLVARGLERVKSGGEIEAGLGTVLAKAREAYLRNKYEV